jgi:small-conductance mechanosensitive channel
MFYDYLYSLTPTQIFTAIGFVVGSFIVGWAFQSLILHRLRVWASKTTWEGDDVIIGAIHGITLFWFVLGGVYGAIRVLSISAPILVIIHKVLIFIFLFSITVVCARIAAGFAGLYSRKAVGAERSISIFTYLARLIVYVTGILMILQTLGVSITPVLTALGVGGLAVALALQDTLSNLFAGLSIIAVRKVRIGEFVRLDSGQDGHVTDITWRYTEICTLANNIVLIPNAKLANAIVTNFAHPDTETSVVVDAAVNYGSDLEKVERISIEVAREIMKTVPGGLPDYTPVVRFNNLGDFSIKFSVVMRCGQYTDQFLIKHEFIKQLMKRYAAEGIQVPYPTNITYLRQSETLSSSV